MNKKESLKKDEAPEGHTKPRNEPSTHIHISPTKKCFARKTSATATSKPQTASTKPASFTKVNLVPAGFAGRRKVVGIRIDESLYRRFKPIAQAYFGSVCRPIEAFMASVIALAETKVNFGSTVEIGRLVIERNLRSRRRLVVEEEVEIVESEEKRVVCGKCGVRYATYRAWFEQGDALSKKVVSDGYYCSVCFEKARASPFLVRSKRVGSHG